MKTSLLSRSLIAGTTLAVGSAVLVFSPATAEVPAAITRAEVISAAAIARGPQPPAAPENNQVRALLEKACDIATDGTELIAAGFASSAVASGGMVDGLLLATNVGVYNDANHTTLVEIRPCTVALLTTTNPAFKMDGDHSVVSVGNGVDGTVTNYLTGGVVVTTPILAGETVVDARVADLTASGKVVRTIQVPTRTKVTTNKTARQKAAAKKTYVSKVKAAKKKYNKAVKKAGKSKSRRAAAKKKYNVRKASYKRTYLKAIAPVVKYKSGTRSQVAESIPFSVTAGRN